MTSTPCWLCGTPTHREWKSRNLPSRLAPEDLKITDAHYGRTLRLLKCGQCGFIFADGQELQELVALYSRLVDDGYVESSDARSLQMPSKKSMSTLTTKWKYGASSSMVKPRASVASR